jgi:hypothetical protein
VIPSRALRAVRPAALLSSLSVVLALAALAALLIGWFWVQGRGDWQARVLWAYWLGTPLLTGASLFMARHEMHLKRFNLTLLGVWAAASISLLAVPLL